MAPDPTRIKDECSSTHSVSMRSEPKAAKHARSVPPLTSESVMPQPARSLRGSEAHSMLRFFSRGFHAALPPPFRRQS